MSFFLLPSLKPAAQKTYPPNEVVEFVFSQTPDFSEPFEDWSSLGSYGFVYSESPDFSDDFESGWSAP